jgi:para-nitrobenzyl esterase
MLKRRVVDVIGLCVGVAGAFAGCGDRAASHYADNADASGSEPDVGDESGPPRVTISDGVLEGVRQGGTRAFLGIPYAKPPLDDLRWKAPQKVETWTGARDASQFGKRCAQRESTTLHNAASEEEDCLYLNVWTAAPKAEKLPVMIWIHGGGNVNGSASEPLPLANMGVLYSGQRLAEDHGVVVVTFNYRLGIFGFLAHPGLIAEGSKSDNQGLWDQRAVFEWVQKNIAQFGGDPKNVTIFGESAGSQDVCFHVAASNTSGLFQRAISESGGCTTSLITRTTAEKTATTLGRGLGCSGDDALTCLRGKRAADLLNFPQLPGQSYGPAVDGDLLPDQPRTLYDSGKIAKVPYLLGSNTDEGTLFITSVVSTQEQLTAAFKKSFGDAAESVAAAYPVSDFMGAKPNPFHAALASATGDECLVCATYDTALRASKSGSAVYMYNFDIPVDPTLTGDAFFGASHGSEITYVFGTDSSQSSEQKAASARMQRYWTNFAKTGTPNDGNDSVWPKFSDRANTRLNLGLDATLVKDFRAKQCGFWRSQYEKQFSSTP